MQLHPAAGRTIGLRHHERDLVLARERFQRWNRKLGRAEEDDAHGARFYVVVEEVVVVAGGVSGIVVCCGSGGGFTGLPGADVPSTPLDGSGGAFPPPFAVGVCVALCGG
jgi:hypothetical protein